MQSLNDVLKLAMSGADPSEIDAMLRKRGDYRPHQDFGVNLQVPWSAGSREDPSYDVPVGSAYANTREIGCGSTRAELGWQGGGGKGALSDSSGALCASSRTSPATEISDAEEANDLGTTAFKEKNWPLASEYFSRAIELAGNDPKAVYFGNRATAALKMGNGLQAVVDGGQATQVDPDYAKGYVRAGQGYLLQGDRSSIQAALSQFTEALQLDPTNKQAKKGSQEAKEALRRIDYPSSSDDEDS